MSDVATFATYHRLQRETQPWAELPSDTSLLDERNAFNAHFEASNTEPSRTHQLFRTLSVRLLSRLTFTRLQGQTDILHIAYSEHALTSWQVSSQTFPTYLWLSLLYLRFKETTIVPVPKNAKLTCLKDYRPVALTSVAMKCFERLVMAHTPSSQTPTPIHIPPQQIHRRCNLYCTPLWPLPLG